MMLSIRRSVCRRERTLPVTIIATSPFFTLEPSPINTSTCMVGSKRANTFLATSTPASIPSSLISNLLFPIASSGIQQRVVWSPSPISSAKERSISLSSNSSTDNILVLIYGLYMFRCAKRHLSHCKRASIASRNAIIRTSK